MLNYMEDSCKYSLLVGMFFLSFVRYKEFSTCLYTPQRQDSQSVLNDNNKSLETGYNLVLVFRFLYFVKYIHCV